MGPYTESELRITDSISTKFVQYNKTHKPLEVLFLSRVRCMK